MKNPVIAVSAIIFSLVLMEARCSEALTFDALQVNPYLKFSSVYDDNVFVQNSGRVSDWYFDVSPGILARLGRFDHIMELEYWADIYRYVDTGDVNDVDDHSVRALASFKFPGGLSLKLTDLGRRGHEKKSEANLAVTGLTALDRFWSNDLAFEAAYDLSDRFKAALAYRNHYIAYSLDTNKFEDVSLNGADATIYYRFMPKTSMLIEGMYNRVYHFENVPGTARLNSNEYWAMAGLTWDITAKSTGTIKGGYEWKVFDNPLTHNFQSGVYEVSLDHRFTPKTAVTISGLRQAHETDDPAVPYYTSTTGAIELRYRPVENVRLRPYFSYARDKYAGLVTVGPNTARRSDGALTAGAEATYDMNKWLSFGVNYTHSKRSSNLTFYDYTDNTVMLTVKATI